MAILVVILGVIVAIFALPWILCGVVALLPFAFGLLLAVGIVCVIIKCCGG